NSALPSANVRQTITLLGSGFTAQTQIVFTTEDSTYNPDLVETRIVGPSQVAADGSSMQVVVPDDAMTGMVRIVGASSSFFLQIVPTIVQVQAPGTFATGNGVTILGS